MIDIEEDVINAVATAVQQTYPNILVLPETVYAPPEYPCICIEESDNYVLQRTRDSGAIENNAVVVYEVNVYSTKSNNKLSEARAIFSVVDAAFEQLGFARTVLTRIAMADATKQRLFGRYTAVTDKNKTIYRR